MPSTLIGTRADDPLDYMEHRVVTVGKTSTLVAEANPNRRCLSLINDSGSVMYITYGVPAAMHLGFRLNKDGGTYPLHTCCQMSIYAISGSNGNRLLVNEGT